MLASHGMSRNSRAAREENMLAQALLNEKASWEEEVTYEKGQAMREQALYA